MDAIPKKVLTPEEFREALSNLSSADKMRIKLAANHLAPITGWDANDLFHEAIARTLNPEGGRHCPANIEVWKFLIGAMRSISSNERNSVDAIIQKSSNLEQYQEEAGFDPPDLRASPEDEAHYQTLIEKVRPIVEKTIGDDEQAMAVFQGVLEEWTPQEVRDAWDMTEKEYDAASQRMRRKLKPAMPKGVLK